MRSYKRLLLASTLLALPWFGCTAVAPKPTFDGAVVENSAYKVIVGFDLRDDVAPKAGILIRPGVPTNGSPESRVVLLPFETLPSYRQNGLVSTWGSTERCCTMLGYLASKNTTGSYVIPLSPVFDQEPDDPTSLPGQLYFLRRGLERKFVYKYDLGTTNLDNDISEVSSFALAPEAIAIATPPDAEWKEVVPGSTESPPHVGTNAVSRFYGVSAGSSGVKELQLRYALPLSASQQLGIKLGLQLLVTVGLPLIGLYFLRVSDPKRRQLRRIILTIGIILESGALLYVGWVAYSARSVDTTEAGLGALIFVVGAGLSFVVAYLSQHPSITSLAPPAGMVGTHVTIVGSNFGSSQGSSIVTFNGVVTAPTTWNETTIIAPVPPAATTGNVVVTVSGVASNGTLFTVA